jgi:hypothetical protein
VARPVNVKISLEDLASALIRLGFFFPSEREEAEVAAKDIFFVVEHPDNDYPQGVWRPEKELPVCPFTRTSRIRI